jgi:hypothetical protein
LGYGQTPYLVKLGCYMGKDKDSMEISLLDFFIMALACFRITRLIVFDKITEFLRAPFFDEIKEENEEGIIEIYYLPSSTFGKKFIGELLSCYWCTGVWVSTGVVVGFLLFPTVFLPLLLIFAIAGLASILESIVQIWVD